MRDAVRSAGRDQDELDIGCTIVASIDEDGARGRDGAREIAGMYLANKVQNIQAAADTLRGTDDRIMEHQIEPLVAEIARRWKLTFGKEGLQLSPDGRITRTVGERTTTESLRKAEIILNS